MQAETGASHGRRLFVCAVLAALVAPFAPPRPGLAAVPDLAAEARGPSRAEDWRTLAGELRDLAAPEPSPGLLARTREIIERRRAEREERMWNRAAIGFLIVFGWTLIGVSWFLFELVLGELAVRFDRPLGPTVLWFATYLVAGWLAAGAAAVLLGRRPHEEGRMA